MEEKNRRKKTTKIYTSLSISRKSFSYRHKEFLRHGEKCGEDERERRAASDESSAGLAKDKIKTSIERGMNFFYVYIL